MSEKRDRQGVRRPTEIERKYNLGGFISEQRQSRLRQDSELKTLDARQTKNEVSTEEKIELLEEQDRSTEQIFNDFKENTENSMNGLKKLMSEYWKTIYPVGAIYMSVNATSPQTLFGGTWEQIQNRFLLAAGSSYSAGSTGGEAEVTLTVDEIPAHSHGLHTRAVYSGGGNYIAHCNKDNAGDYSYTTDSKGGGAAHNNMPPYLAVYVWKRTA